MNLDTSNQKYLRVGLFLKSKKKLFITEAENLYSYLFS